MFAHLRTSLAGLGARVASLAPLQQAREMGSRRETVLRLAKGFRGRAKNCFRIAIRRVEKSLQHAYRGRRLTKRNARRTWIVQLGAATQEHGIRYSQFIHGLKQAEIGLNRKILAQLAQQEPYSFRAVADEAKGGLARMGWVVGDTGAWFLPRNRAQARDRGLDGWASLPPVPEYERGGMNSIAHALRLTPEERLEQQRVLQQERRQRQRARDTGST